ncbi:hypothetical protein QOZ98_000355 [Planomicrobium stackebrandtii]|uniref:DUF4064 domain-containing protein n=1 Tax=Planomicrobium stackebrandtii TaxID=253160 RepID=A0ABU0GQ99_9BACL|nr:hypothetical protein [Planomicrobium stackebrandtii]MDQ0427530.1 hypothetical protein [Planomicrobium stackebrandtii]
MTIIEPNNLQSSRKLVTLSIVLLAAIVAVSGFFLNSLDRNQLVQNFWVDMFQNDSKIQQDMSRGEATISAEEFASDNTLIAKNVLVIPYYMLIIATVLSLLGFLTIGVNPVVATVFLALAGILSLFTIFPAILLFRASGKLFEAIKLERITFKEKAL